MCPCLCPWLILCPFTFSAAVHLSSTTQERLAVLSARQSDREASQARPNTQGTSQAWHRPHATSQALRCTWEPHSQCGIHVRATGSANPHVPFFSDALLEAGPPGTFIGQDLVVNTTLMELYASWSRKQPGVKCCTIDILWYILGILMSATYECEQNSQSEVMVEVCTNQGKAVVSVLWSLGRVVRALP